MIGGAITPLWQSLKTTEATHLRVVRVTSDAGQRIVGVQISSDQVGEVLRALGVASTLREPDGIFNGVLLDGEEIPLTAGLRLKRGSIHREPAIELCGAPPSLFVTLRKLGLINEQINFKQRFFVPVEEERGNAIITTLLEQFPVIADEIELEDHELSSETSVTPISSTQVVDLENWLIQPPDLRHHSDEPELEQTSTTESECGPSDEEDEPRGSQRSESLSWLIADPLNAPAMLPRHTCGHSPVIQLGFNFAGSEF